jgi:LacI family transcriptional regulator
MKAPLERVTIQEIARRAGVHKSTVSRALRAASEPNLSDAPGSELTQRIVGIARDLGYQPDYSAAGLRTRRTRSIGVLVPRLTDVVLATIYEGIESTVRRHGYQALVANTNDDPAQRQELIDVMQSRRIDGLIVADAHLDAEGIGSASVPTVLVNRRLPGMPSFTCDDEEGGRLVGRHFAELGHTQVAIIAGPAWASTGVDRTRGCLEALKDAAVAIPRNAVVHSGFDSESGYAVTRQLLRRRKPPTAIFAVNDYAAIGALAALRDLGLRPGEDVAISGFNDIGLARQLPLPLTSVDSGATTMGVKAGLAVMDVVNDREVSSVRTSPVLHIRATTKPGVPTESQ